MCSECGLDAPLVRRTPDEKKPNIEFRTFECKCGHKMVRTTQLDADLQSEQLAERIAGLSTFSPEQKRVLEAARAKSWDLVQRTRYPIG